MDIIKVLPDAVANQIAAGEVIQRPASVIKELVENSIDAGARNIDVLVTDAGKTSIQVIDDGKGMSEMDARLAFERHATSKIRRAEDLFTLHTMGFRGEALPSIVAVAQVTLQTRTAESDLGTKLEIEGSKVISQEICSCQVGANFEVRNLFFNIPARRKFLKSNSTELNNIIQEFERIALVNPSVSFTFSSDGNLQMKLPADNLRQRITDIFKNKISDQMIAVDVDTSIVKITGFVGRPETAHKKGVRQFFFVNGRYMRHPYFNKAVLTAFEGLVPEGEQVPYFLYFDIDPSNVDVNISPTKTEVKFENEQAIWQIVIAGIHESLGRFQATPTIDFDQVDCPKIPVTTAKPAIGISAPTVHVDNNFNPFDRKKTSAPRDWQSLYEGLLPEGNTTKTDESPFLGDNLTLDDMDISTQHFQFKGQYIMAAARSGLMVINQHRAHIRVLYDKYLREMENRHVPTQGLFFSEVLQLPLSDANILDDIIPELHSLGFDVVSIGGGSYSINGMPVGTEGLEPQKLIKEMIGTVREKEVNVTDDSRHKMALALARNTSIVSGQVLNQEEIDNLVSDLFLSSNPNYAPDGKVIISIIPQQNIDELFS